MFHQEISANVKRFSLGMTAAFMLVSGRLLWRAVKLFSFVNVNILIS